MTNAVGKQLFIDASWASAVQSGDLENDEKLIIFFHLQELVQIMTDP